MTASPLRRNIELKSRCPDLAAAARAAAELGAARQGVFEQIDTYFRVSTGRLKLRETTGRPAELIWYARPDAGAPRNSDYILSPAPEAESLKAALAAAAGVRGEVRKCRELWVWHNVRIHLDAVEGLGTFVEFEAVMTAGEDDRIAHGRLATLSDALSLRAAERVANSYSDLLGI